MLIEKATQPEELLALLGSDHGLHHHHAALILIQLSRLLSERPADKAWLLQEPRFLQLLHLVNSQVGADSTLGETQGRLLEGLRNVSWSGGCQPVRSSEDDLGGQGEGSS